MQLTRSYTSFSELPNLGRLLATFPLIDKIGMKLAGNETFFANSIKKAISDKRPYVVIIETIKDAARDNYVAVADQLGCPLTDEILKW